MTSMQPDLLEVLPDEAGDGLALPSFVVLARFAEPGQSRAEAESAVEVRLRHAGLEAAEVTSAPEPLESRWVVTARFVVVSVEAHTAVAGVHDSLTAAGVPFDEAWADSRYA